MANSLEDLAGYLIDNNFATVLDDDIFIEYAPKDKKDFIAIMEYDNGNFDRKKESITRKIQINVFGMNALSVRNKINRIFKTLSGSESKDWVIDYKTDRFFIFTMIGTPFKLKRDESGRFIYSFNMKMTTNNNY